MNGCFRNDVGIETVAKVDGIDVVTIDLISDGSDSTGRGHKPFEIAVHDGEEDLEEKIDGIY